MVLSAQYPKDANDFRAAIIIAEIIQGRQHEGNKKDSNDCVAEEAVSMAAVGDIFNVLTAVRRRM